MPSKRSGRGNIPSLVNASYKGAAGLSLEPNREVEAIRAEPSEGAREAMPGRMMQRKLGRPDALPQQAW